MQAVNKEEKKHTHSVLVIEQVQVQITGFYARRKLKKKNWGG